MSFRPKHVVCENIVNRYVLVGIILIPIVKKQGGVEFSYNYSLGISLTILTVHFGEDLGDGGNPGLTPS